MQVRKSRCKHGPRCLIGACDDQYPDRGIAPTPNQRKVGTARKVGSASPLHRQSHAPTLDIVVGKGPA